MNTLYFDEYKAMLNKSKLRGQPILEKDFFMARNQAKLSNNDS